MKYMLTEGCYILLIGSLQQCRDYVENLKTYHTWEKRKDLIKIYTVQETWL